MVAFLYYNTVFSVKSKYNPGHKKLFLSFFFALQHYSLRPPKAHLMNFTLGDEVTKQRTGTRN